MKKKITYEPPELFMISFYDTDIITVSNGGNNIGEDKGENDGEWM